jgi:hypothetical protein
MMRWEVHPRAAERPVKDGILPLANPGAAAIP